MLKPNININELKNENTTNQLKNFKYIFNKYGLQQIKIHFQQLLFRLPCIGP